MTVREARCLLLLLLLYSLYYHTAVQGRNLNRETVGGWDPATAGSDKILQVATLKIIKKVIK